MFMISMVPLRLMEELGNNLELPGNNKEFWRNERPSSVQYCRPIEFSYIKETKEVILQKYNMITEQIKTLSDTVVTTKHGIKIKIRHNLKFTMVDGKVAQAISGIYIYNIKSYCIYAYI